MQDILSIYRVCRYQCYRDLIKNYLNSHTFFQFFELGDLNRDKQIYVINETNPSSGFFWCWRQTIKGLMVADRYGFVPVVDWSNSPYYMPDGFKGIMNPFEYYFEPVSPISLQEAEHSYNVTFYSAHSDGMPDRLYDHQVEAGLLEVFAEVNKRHLRLRKELLEDITSQVNGLLQSKKTLGVHVRGVEWGNIQGHPIPVSLETYINEIDSVVEDKGFEQIFLATDSEDTVSYFVGRYGSKIVYYEDIIRTPKGDKTLVIFDNSIKREDNQFWLGYEVLKDMLTLSYCSGLIAGFSHVSFAAEVFKKGYGEDYEFKKLVEQKVNTIGISPNKAASLMRKRHSK